MKKNKITKLNLLERYGLGENMIRVIRGLHETTSYKVRGKEGVSGEWLLKRGLREGCSTSPVLFNIYHQAVMRQAGEKGWELGLGGSREGLSQVPKPGRGGVLRPRQWWCRHSFLFMTPPLWVGRGNWEGEWGQ